MLSSFTTRCNNFIWFLIFTFTLSSMPHLDLLFPYKIHFHLFAEAEGSEAPPPTNTQMAQAQTESSETPSTTETSAPAEPPSSDSPTTTPSEETDGATQAASSSSSESQNPITPSVSFKVDDFTGGAHLNYPIAVPPARGAAPQVSLNYSSSGGNGLLGVGWDLAAGGYIQRRGPRKGVPKYDSTDVFELNLGGAPQELVPIGGGEYRLRIEGAYLKITFDSYNNIWAVWDKSGILMRFGYSVSSRLGKVRDPYSSTDTYRWCLDRVEDPKSNYMEYIYWRDQDTNFTYQIYLQEINYNARVAGMLPHNHRIIFTLEPPETPRPDPIYNYRGGFKMLTQRRLASIEVKTNETRVRKYQFQYDSPKPNARSVLSAITLYGNAAEPTSFLPPTTFTYQTHNLGFDAPVSWPNPSVWEVEGEYYGSSAIRESMPWGTISDVMDINGDGMVERVLYDLEPPYTAWGVYQNSKQGFLAPPLTWSNPSAWDSINGNYIRNNYYAYGIYTDVFDLNGDGLSDRVVYDKDPPYDGPWTIYSNSGNGFGTGTSWPNPSATDGAYGNYLRGMDAFGNGMTEVIDMNGDGLPDRVVYAQPDWRVYLNTGNGFDSNYVTWINPSPPTYFIRHCDPSGFGCYADLIDMNGDGLPDRVVKTINNPWQIYFNNGTRFDDAVTWTDPDSFAGYIHSTWPIVDEEVVWTGTFGELVDLNGDGLPDRVIYDFYNPSNPWRVYFNNGNGFGPMVSWTNAAGAHVRSQLSYEGGGMTFGDVFDINGDGLVDWIYDDPYNYYNTLWTVYLNRGQTPDLLSGVDNGIGGSIQIEYRPSTDYDNTGGDGKSDLPFVVQTVHKYTQRDGRNNTYTAEYDYEGGYYDPVEVEFRGFKKVTACQPDCGAYESLTETWFHQDYFAKGRMWKQLLTSKEEHLRETISYWTLRDTLGGGKFPYIYRTTSTITDDGYPSYSLNTYYNYDEFLNLSWEEKVGGTASEDIIHTYFQYTPFTGSWILSKPTEIRVTDGNGNIVSRKWMEYDPVTGNLEEEEVCKTDTPSTGCNAPNPTQNSVISYEYEDNNPYKNLWRVTDPGLHQTTFIYDSSQTLVYQTTNALGHVTTTVYDPGTGNLTQLIPPHLQATGYSIISTSDPFGRKKRETRPDGGWTEYTYVLPPDGNYVLKQEHIVGGPTELNHLTYNYFDGLGRSYWVSSSGPDGKSVITATGFDSLGRLAVKSSPYFYGIDTPYYTCFTYDGLSRVTNAHIQTPDCIQNGYHITTSYQGLKKVVTDQNNHSTAYTYDVYQRLIKVEQGLGFPEYALTEYKYDTLGNLTQVIAPKLTPDHQNITTMTYDSLSKKTAMADPDMGSWIYRYDKSGNLEYQKDAKLQEITFSYDALNRVTEKIYVNSDPPQKVTYAYDDPTVPFSKGALTKVSYLSGSPFVEVTADSVLEFDRLQRVTRSKKKIETAMNEVTVEKVYDTAGRVITLRYIPTGFPAKYYNYEYDIAGNLLHLEDYAQMIYLASYSNFTALGQPGNVSIYPKPGNVGVNTTYTYHPETGRLKTLLTQKVVGGTPTANYQNLHYEYDPKGNIGYIEDNLYLGRVHAYSYDSLDRLRTAEEWSGLYYHTFEYDKIGNITYKSDVGTYTYDYANRPHAVKSIVANSPVYNDPIINIEYNFDQKPKLIKRDGIDYLRFTYDGNGQRVKKENLSTGNTVHYFGDLFENRGGVGIYHLFAGNRRVASIRTDGKNQFYHPNHLGSAAVITDENGDWKERIQYYPFGTYLEDVKNPPGTDFPDANYTFTDQEDDDDIGLYNYGARLYDPVLGRFISPDSIVQAPDDPQTLNRYAYARNNPLIYVDPSGNLFIIDDILIGAAIGAIIGGATAAIQGGNILQGMAMGAITGSFMGPASGGGLLIEAAAGAAAGATNAAIFGGNVGMGALSGGLFSVASSLIGPPNIFGDIAKTSEIAAIGNRVLNAAVIGAGFGAAYAGITGGNILKGAGAGALGWAAGEGANILIGYGAGLIMSGGTTEFKEGVRYYYTKDETEFPFSVGGIVIGGKEALKHTMNNQVDTWKDHELSHIFGKQKVLGPAYIPAHLLSQGISGMIGLAVDGKFLRHDYNLFEREWIEVPNP